MRHYTAREMVRDLMDAGLAQHQIADRAQVSQATIARVSRGADTRYETGKRIADLHRQVCPGRYTPQPTPSHQRATTA